MPRNLGANIINQLTAQDVRIAIFAQLEFSTNIVRLWTGITDVSWNSQTWLGNGWIHSIDPVQESEDLKVTGLSIKLGGVDPSLEALIFNSARQYNLGTFWIAFLDASGAIVSSPYQFFKGKLDVPQIDDSGTESTITISYESDLIRLDEPPAYRYTDQSQQALFSGDKGFQYVAQLEDWSGYWGKPEKIKLKTKSTKATQVTPRKQTVKPPAKISSNPPAVIPSKRSFSTLGKVKARRVSLNKIKSTITLHGTGPRRSTLAATRGKQVSVRVSDSPRQIIYGSVKTGGVYSFIETDSTAKALLLTGTGDAQIGWTAKAAGDTGNAITVQIILSGTHGTLDCAVVGSAITITLKSSAGLSQSTAADVIAKVKATPAAAALVSVSKGQGSGAGYCLNQATTNLANGGGTRLHHFITVAGHEIQSIDALYLNKDQVIFGASPDPRWATGKYTTDKPKVFMAVQYGTDTQDAQPDLCAQLPTKWTSAHTQSGCAGAYIITVWEPNLFSEGLPDVMFSIKGKKCYDPRSATTVWTDNAALIIADYLCDARYGLGVLYADIDETLLIAAANTCDELVTKLDSSTEKRYTINGYFDSSQTPKEILDEMEQAMAGSVVWEGGVWKLYAGTWRAPSITLSEDDLRGPIQISVMQSRRDMYNRVRGKFISPDLDQKETDFPSVVNALYLTEDGRELWEDVTFNLTKSSAACQRISKIKLERVRQSINVQMKCSLKAYRLEACDTVQLTLAKYGWVAKIFEVIDIELDIDPDNGTTVALTLQETASGVWDWNSGNETVVDLAPNATLPDPFTVGVPQNVALTSGAATLYVRDDGTIFSRLKVAWDAPTDQFVLYGGLIEIQYKQNSSGTWSSTYTVSGNQNFMYILDVLDNVTYDVQVRAKNTVGSVSSWVQISAFLVQGKSAPPDDVGGLTGNADQFGIALSWGALDPLRNSDLKEYELRSGSSWASGTIVAAQRGTSLRLPIKTAGSYTFYIKAIDTSGNYSTNANSITVTIAGAAAPTVSSSFSAGNAVISWTIPSSLFAIDSYAISYGATFAGSTAVGNTKGTSLSIPVNWSGSRTFWVAAIDAASNVGSAGAAAVNVVTPGQVSGLASTTIDNNVILTWTAPAVGSLPIHHYNVRKGASFGSATLRDVVVGTFSTFFETVSTTYTYWITAVDVAGNEGTETSLGVFVNAPPDYSLKDDQILDPAGAGTLTSIVIE